MKERLSLTMFLWLCTFSISGCISVPSRELTTVLDKSRQQQQDARRLNAESLKVGQNLPRKRDLLEQALAKDELFGEAHNNLGVVLYQQKNFYEAASHFKRAADLLPGSPMPLVNLALLHAELGQWDRALPYARKAYDCDQYHVGAVQVLAMCMVENRIVDKDIHVVLERLTMVAPNDTWRIWASKYLEAYKDKQILE